MIAGLIEIGTTLSSLFTKYIYFGQTIPVSQQVNRPHISLFVNKSLTEKRTLHPKYRRAHRIEAMYTIKSMKKNRRQILMWEQEFVIFLELEERRSRSLSCPVKKIGQWAKQKI